MYVVMKKAIANKSKVKITFEAVAYAIDINDYIWSQGRNKNIELKPYHLTRNTNY